MKKMSCGRFLIKTGLTHKIKQIALIQSFITFLFIYLLFFPKLAFSQSQQIEYKLGEQTPNGRPYPRLSPPNWQAVLDVGPSVNFRTSHTLTATTANVDVVIQTFTSSTNCQCTTSLGLAGSGFPYSKITKNGDNAIKIDLEGSKGTVLRHRAVFTNLIPGKYYHYKVSCTYPNKPGHIFGNTKSVFRATPLPNDKKDTQIALFSDFAGNTAPDEYLSSDWFIACRSDYMKYLLLEKLRDKRRLDLVLMPGDIMQGGHNDGPGTPSGTYWGYLTRFHSMFELIQAGIPILPVQGNHDVIDYGWPACRKDNVAKYFKMMATPWSRDAKYKNQWWSLDWGNTHIVGLDLIFDQGQEGFRRDAKDCDLSFFYPGSEQRNWFLANLSEVEPTIKWRIIFQHGFPKHYDGTRTEENMFDPTGPCGGSSGEYENYCADMDAENIDLIFAGHSGESLRRFLAAGGQGENMLYGFRTNYWYVNHLRLRSDAIIISVIVPDGGPFPGPGLIECFKYVPGVKSGCDNSMCIYRDYKIERIIDPNCATTATNFMMANDLKPTDGDTLLVPCCKSIDPTNPNKCIDANGVSVSRIVTIRIQECDRGKIQPGCLKRQILPIVINPTNGRAVHVTNPELLKECTPCGRKIVNGTQQIIGYESNCGKKYHNIGRSPWLPQVFTN